MGHVDMCYTGLVGMLVAPDAPGGTELAAASLSYLDLAILTMVVVLLNSSLIRSFLEIKKVLQCDPERDLQLFPFIHWLPSSLSPSWNFFGPNPGHYDYRILVRAQMRHTHHHNVQLNQ